MKIFISYCRDDISFVESLRADLSQLGHDAWMDQRLLGGQEWWDEILRNIRESDLFVLALSPKSIQSDACLLELKYACAVHRPFLPAMVLPTDLNFLPPEIAHAQFVDYTRSDRESLLHLVAAITQLPPTPPPPDPLPEPPVMPQGPLYEARRLIELATELDRKHQLWLVDTLQQNSANPRLKTDVTELLAEFRQRNDLMADVLAKVDELLRSLQSDWQPLRPTRPKAWLAVLIAGVLASIFAAIEFPSTDKGVSYYEAVMDFAAVAAIYAFALRRKPRFLGWWLIFWGFALDGVWSLFWPFLQHQQGTFNDWIGVVGPLVLLAAGLLLFRPPWQAGRFSLGHAVVAIVAATLATIVAVKSMPSGYALTTFGYAISLASTLFIAASVWVMLEQGTTALIRLGLCTVALLVYVNATFVTHLTTGTYTTWMAFPWQVAGFTLASIAAFAAARWPGGQWPTPPPQPKLQRPKAAQPSTARVPWFHDS